MPMTLWQPWVQDFEIADPYQKNLSVLNWDDYDMVGSGVGSLMKRGTQSLGGPLEDPHASILAIFTWVAGMAFRFLGLCKRLFLGANHT